MRSAKELLLAAVPTPEMLGFALVALHMPVELLGQQDLEPPSALAGQGHQPPHMVQAAHAFLHEPLVLQQHQLGSHHIEADQRFSLL
jgi:hypothetical protein